MIPGRTARWVAEKNAEVEAERCLRCGVGAGQRLRKPS